MRALVTGATGFIGFNLVQRLINDGHTVFGTGDPSENIPGCKIISRSFNRLDWKALGQIDVVFHQAAITDTMVYDRDQMFMVNFWYSRQLVDQAIRAGVKQIVYASSAATYGGQQVPFKENGKTQALNVYAESKLLLDHYAQIIKTYTPHVTMVGLRYSNVYGPGEDHKGRSRSMVKQLYDQMSAGNPRLFEFGEQRRDFVYIDDVVEANLLAAGFVGDPAAAYVFNVGSGIDTSFNEIVESLNNEMGLTRETEYFPNSLRGLYQDQTLLDLAWSHEKLGYYPKYDIKKGIARYLSAIKMGHPCPVKLPC